MSGSGSFRRLLLPGLDVVSLVGAFLAAVYLRLGQSASAMLGYDGLALRTFLNSAVVLVCLYYSGHYEEWQTKRPLETAVRTVQALVAGTLLLLTVYYALPDLAVGRGILVRYLPLSLVLLVSLRAVYRWIGEDEALAQSLGRLLRKARLDELPQLINVVRGEMSFVGPRPERPHFVAERRKVIPFYDERHSVRPGITGWAQVKFGYGSSLEDTERKLEYDLYYIKHMSWAFDVGILLYTAKIVLGGKGAR